MKLPKEPVPLWPDAGDILGLGRSKMFELAAGGAIATVKKGRKRFVAPAEIKRLVEDQAKKPEARSTSPAKKPAGKAPAKKTAGTTKKSATSTPPPAVEPPLSDGAFGAFGARGRRLWDAYCELVDGQRGLVLLEEACRTADRLDRLEALLQGDVDVWARLVHNLRTQDYELRIDSALIEARQQGAALRQLIAALPLKESDDGDDDEGDWTAGLQP